MIKYLDYNGICPWCGHPFKDGLIEIHVAVPFLQNEQAMYEITYTYICHECGNETVVARNITNATNSWLARVARVTADTVRKKVESYSKLHD